MRAPLCLPGATIRPSASKLRPERPKPLWVRLTALLCVLLCLGGGIAQACHSHVRQDKSKRVVVSAALLDGSGGEKLCPLCVGFHFGSPDQPPQLVLGRQLLPLEPRVQPISLASRPLPFSLNSRPPPAAALSL